MVLAVVGALLMSTVVGGGEGGGKIASRSLCSEMLACLPCISGLFWLC